MSVWFTSLRCVLLFYVSQLFHFLVQVGKQDDRQQWLTQNAMSCYSWLVSMCYNLITHEGANAQHYEDKRSYQFTAVEMFETKEKKKKKGMEKGDRDWHTNTNTNTNKHTLSFSFSFSFVGNKNKTIKQTIKQRKRHYEKFLSFQNTSHLVVNHDLQWLWVAHIVLPHPPGWNLTIKIALT